MILVIGGLVFWRHQSASRPNPVRYPILGLSLSQDDGYVDFHKLADQKIDFAYLKVSQGANYSDNSFTTNYTRASGTRIVLGTYLDFSFDSSPEQQAKNFIDHADDQIGTLPIAIRVTYYGRYEQKKPNTKATQQKLLKLINLLRAHYQNRECIVWGTSEALQQLVPKSWVTQRWVDGNTPDQTLPNLKFWQFTDSGKITSAGNQRYHLAVFNGTKREWNKEK